MRTALVAISLLCSTICPVLAQDLTDPDQARTWLAGWLDRPYAPPSLSVAVSVGDEIVLAQAVGYADLEAKIAATPGTTYRTYSISKGVTAVCIMQLVEQDRIDLQDEIQKYVPEFPRKKWPVRLEHLIAHTSGIRHYKKNAGEISSTLEYPSLASSLAVFKDAPLLFKPGTASQYTTFGFNLLTGVVERSSGGSFESYLRQHVFEPAGMTASGLAVAGGESRAVARPYWRPRKEEGANVPIQELPNVSGRYGSSGVVSTPTDLVRLFLALQQGELLRPETVKKMFSPPYPAIDADQAYGWNLERKEGRTEVYRSGAGTGYTGAVLHLPVEGVTAALLVNQNQYKERWELLELLVEAFLNEVDD